MGAETRTITGTKSHNMSPEQNNMKAVLGLRATLCTEKGDSWQWEIAVLTILNTVFHLRLFSQILNFTDLIAFQSFCNSVTNQCCFGAINQPIYNAILLEVWTKYHKHHTVCARCPEMDLMPSAHARLQIHYNPDLDKVLKPYSEQPAI